VVEDSAVQCEQIFDIEQEHMSRKSHDQFLSELGHASFVMVMVCGRVVVGGGGGGGRGRGRRLSTFQSRSKIPSFLSW